MSGTARMTAKIRKLYVWIFSGVVVGARPRGAGVETWDGGYAVARAPWF